MAGAATLGHHQNAAASGVTGTLAGTVTPTGAISAAHGVSGTFAGTITPTGAIAAQFGVTCVNADWGSDVRSDGTKGHLDGDDFAGNDGTSATWRWAQKFDLSAISGTVTKVELIVNVVAVPGSGSTWDVGPYGTNGQDDPEADSGATMYSRCLNSGQYVNDTTVFATTGSKTLDLGSTAVSHVQAALGGIFSVSCVYNDTSTASAGATIEEYSGESNPPELCVTWTPSASVTGTLAGTITPTGSISAAHGVSGTLAGTITPTGAIAASHGVSGALAGTLTPTGAVQMRHGVAGTLAGTVTATGAVSAAHGVSGTIAGTLAPTGSVAAAHGVSGALAGAIAPTGTISATFGAGSVTGTLAGSIVPTGAIQMRFQTARAAAVKHYPADDTPEPKPKPKRRRRKRVVLEQPQEQGGQWEMPAPRPAPIPEFTLEIPRLPPFRAPELPPEPEPIPPVEMRLAGVLQPFGRVDMLFVPPDRLAQALAEDQLLLGLM